MLMRDQAEFNLAVRLRAGIATLGEIYAFISGLYFRGKVAYSGAFGSPPPGVSSALAIVPGVGLLPLNTVLTLDQLLEIARVPIDLRNTANTAPFVRDLSTLDHQAGPACRFILLGSIATEKYTGPLLETFGDRLLFPAEFVGRGDMSRGGLMLRCASTAQELAYIAVKGAARRGNRPPKLQPVRSTKSRGPGIGKPRASP